MNMKDCGDNAAKHLPEKYLEKLVQIIEKVNGEAGVDPFKVRKIISIIKDFDKAKNVKNLVNVLAHCP
jgi:hypothetical protein